MKKILRSAETQLFLISFLTLFLQLLLIRYLSGNIWNLGYFPNLILISAFVGMGIGFVFHSHVKNSQSDIFFVSSVPVLLSLVLFVHFLHPELPGFSISEGTIANELYFASVATRGSLSYVHFIIWFLSCVLIFALISQKTAKLFIPFTPLKAYSFNVFGACVGILVFILVSYNSLSAYTWFFLLIPLFILSLKNISRRALLIIVSILVFITALVKYQDTALFKESAKPDVLEVRWSPYQRVDYRFNKENNYAGIFANRVFHQLIYSKETIVKSFYKLPYLHRKQYKNLKAYKSALVIGAGTGNDVTAALHYGVDEVDAVEIDPVIADFGKKYHLASPYDDNKVRLIIDDGRSFMTQTQNKYDVIIYALPDSVIKTSPLAQLRLENYLFTKESIVRAFELLNPDGDLYLYNYYRTPWLIQKIYMLLLSATETNPDIIIQNKDFVIFKVHKDESAKPVIVDSNTDSKYAVPTDDWPFLYLMKRSVPSFYLVAMLCVSCFIGILMAVLHYTGKKFEDYSSSKQAVLQKIAFVMMGMAFLLLETKSVVQFSLLFGTTWLNSSLVFLSVLALVLLANLCAYIIKSKKLLLFAYLLLIVSSLITLYFPISNLLYVQFKILRFLFSSILIFLPVFFANLIFSVTFKNQKIAEHMFGWNMIGATLGGILEYTSMAIGYNSLTVLVAFLYTAVFILLRISSQISSEAKPV